MSEVTERARVALSAWLAALPAGTKATIPKPPRERERDDSIRLFDPAPGSSAYRDGASVWDVMSEYTLISSGYVPDRSDVTEAELFDEGADIGIGVHDPGRAARRKEERRAPRARTRVKVGDLPDLSALAKLEPSNQWAGELVTELLTRKLKDGRRARLPEATGPEYINRGVLGWAFRVAARRGGYTRLGPLTLARVLADPVALAAHLDDEHARRHVQKTCPPQGMNEIACAAPLTNCPILSPQKPKTPKLRTA